MFATCHDRRLKKAEVFCNGEKLKSCFAADEELGIALCYARDENGSCYMDSETKTIKKILV